jgi:primase-polymerase (primpol)-like protein
MKAKLIKENLLLEAMETDTITVKVRKNSGKNLKELLDYIKSIGNIGHSFSIIVDPENNDYKKEFFWDGDGSDYIDTIEL